MRHIRCSRRRARHRLRRTPPSLSLWVVRRFSPSAMNVSHSPFPLRALFVSLGGFGFGVSCSLSVPANAFCRRQPTDAGQAWPSRRDGRSSKVCVSSASVAARPFGGAERASHSMAAFRGGSIRLQQPTPNQALQRTVPRVTVAAVLARARLVRSWLCPTPAAVFCAPPSQLPRHAPRSLSYRSLGVSSRFL